MVDTNLLVLEAKLVEIIHNVMEQKKYNVTNSSLSNTPKKNFWLDDLDNLRKEKTRGWEMCLKKIRFQRINSVNYQNFKTTLNKTNIL